RGPLGNDTRVPETWQWRGGGGHRSRAGQRVAPTLPGAGSSSPSALTARRGTLRIIGGDWRGRRLSFPDLPGVRPSPDRLREALFNWLSPFIEGAHCLDLFAGSGALGLEALSRGAGEVAFVDCSRKVLEAVQQHLDRLGGAERGSTCCSDARQYLQ